jgi:hypothetical protein
VKNSLFGCFTGDSDSAAFGSRASKLLEMTSEERDISFVTGRIQLESNLG